MSHSIEIKYPDPNNPEFACLHIGVCQMGNYVIAGRSRIMKMNIDYEEAKNLSTELIQLKSMNGGTVRLGHSDGAIHIDGVLATEIYAALIGMITEIELGDDLAAFDAESCL